MKFWYLLFDSALATFASSVVYHTGKMLNIVLLGNPITAILIFALAFVIVGLLRNLVIDICDPVFRAACKLGVDRDVYKMFGRLFDRIGIEEKSSGQGIGYITDEVVLSNPVEWYRYCYSRRNEIVPIFKNGEEIPVQCEDESRPIRCTIRRAIFSKGWLLYIAEFSEPVYINGEGPSTTHELPSAYIYKIMDGEIRF